MASPSTPPTTQIISAIDLVTEILRLTPLLSLSTRSSIDQIVLSTALRTGISDDISCALHKAIVGSILFPAGIAIIPHAIKILHRDMASNVEKVKDSAMKGLAQIEGILRPRLPAQKGPAVQSKDDEEEEDEITEEDAVEVEEMVMDEIVVAQAGFALEEPERVSRPEAEELVKVVPSFVAGSKANATPSTAAGATSSINSGQSVPVTIDTATTTVKVVTQKRDVFSMGAWKSQKEDDDDEELDIPEIDMGFDSDEE
jgi:hypothetical protein